MNYSPTAFRDGVFSQADPLVRGGYLHAHSDGSLGNAPSWWPRAPYPYPPSDPYVQMFDRGAVGQEGNGAGGLWLVVGVVVGLAALGGFLDALMKD